MRRMLKHLLSLEDVNWWLLAGGMALNVGIAVLATILGAYLSLAEGSAEAYALYGAPLVMLGVFVASLLSGALIGRLSDQVPLRHAFLSGLGGAAAFIFGAVFTLNYMLLLLAVVAVLGNLNGAMLALPRPHSRP